MRQHVDLQDVFLSKIRKESVSITIALTDGKEIEGIVEGFDSYTIILKSGNKQQLIYKHAISMIIPHIELDF